jgi:hypothetical protein
VDLAAPCHLSREFDQRAARGMPQPKRRRDFAKALRFA